jgi:predicted nucleic acid-binding protein
MVLSEFVNAYARMVFNQKRKEDGQESLEFKDFRSTNDFKDVAEETSYFVKKIMSDSHKLNCNIDETNVFHTIVPKYETGKYDFNDLFIEETCKNHNLILVTNDRDLQKSGIPILTANSAMLKGNR